MNLMKRFRFFLILTILTAVLTVQMSSFTSISANLPDSTSDIHFCITDKGCLEVDYFPEHILIITGQETDEEKARILHEWDTNHDIKYLIIIDDSLIEDTGLTRDISYITDDEYALFQPFDQLWHVFRTTNVRRLVDAHGTQRLAAVNGLPGMTLTINRTVSASHTVTGNLGLGSNPSISGAVGFSVTGSTSVSVIGSDVVPQRYNGHNVRSMTLVAFPLMERHSFTITKETWAGATLISTQSSNGIASRPIGIALRREFFF